MAIPRQQKTKGDEQYRVHTDCSTAYTFLY